MSSPGAAPGVFGILRPVLLLPAGLELRLTPEELASVIAHETAHARHRDNLTASLHALISAVFWFHPFVWWIGRRMSDERERAADEAAVAAGFSPRVYAGGLLKVCRSAVRPALACAARVDGSNLTRRIEGIMKHSQIRNVHPVLRLTVASLAVLFAAGPVLIGMSRSVVTEASWASRSLPASPEPAESPQVGEPIAGSEAADQWVRQEVAYIIGKEERGAFEALATTEERRHFIEQFWQRRDPTPGTENEFHEEHDRRFAEANRRFAYGDLAGWETDRGRIYVAYGEPARVETGVSGAGQPTSIAVERWQYDFIEGLGLDVVLTFVDVNRTGEYLLMNPEPTAAEAASEPLRIGAGVLPPRVIARIEPEYPPDARAARVEGPVVLDAVVGRDGAVDVRRVVRSLRPDMDDAAVEAIRQWRFSPGTRDGEPVDVALNIEVHFSLR
jgi:TonB family protein